MTVAYTPKSFCEHNPAAGRWDEFWLSRLLHGVEHALPGRHHFTYTPDDGTEGRVVIFPAGHYHECEHCPEPDEILQELDAYVRQLDWAIVMATADECALFPWRRWGIPERVRLWVQTPKPDLEYPEGTRFLPIGAPHGDRLAFLANSVSHVERELDVFFSGQGGHDIRDQAIEALLDMPARSKYIARTPGFTQGMPHDDYEAYMVRAKVAPAPGGPCTPDTFRFYEAIAAGAVPLRDGDPRFWQMLFPVQPFAAPLVTDWDRVTPWVSTQVADYPRAATAVGAWWRQERRRIAIALNDEVDALAGANPLEGADDEITVIIPTSPIPSNPNAHILLETITSVRRRLPTAEIFICFDGVREEQEDRYADYYEACRRVVAWAQTDIAAVPIVFPAHRHQSGMMREVLQGVRTPYVMYVEHDTPLEGDVPFDRILNTMEHNELSVMRLYHETELQPGSEHLFLQGFGEGDEVFDLVPWRQTVQWSQRPHIAHTDWYRDVMATYFGKLSRTFIEDVLHGVIQNGLPPFYDTLPEADIVRYRDAAEQVWRSWRIGMYTPEGSWKRSGHTDGREGDEKYPMYISYDGERPAGAPQEGQL